MTAAPARPSPGASEAAIDRLFVAVAIVAVGSLAVALVSQHVFGMEPCPWCVLQRLVFGAIAALALVGLAWRSAVARRVAAVLALAFALAGVAAALWQHFVAAGSASCNLTLADRIMSATQLDNAWPDVFMARASCADAAVDLLGVPYAFWAAVAFLVCAVLLLRVIFPTTTEASVRR